MHVGILTARFRDETFAEIAEWAGGAGFGAIEAATWHVKPEEVLAEVKNMVKNLASLQEIHYANHYTYTLDTEVLFSGFRGGVPDGLEVDLFFADAQGWAGMVTHAESGARCVLAYGYYVPMGWTPGMVICP